MDHQFTRTKKTNWRGRSVFYSLHKISLKPHELTAAKQAGLLTLYVYAPPELEKQKRPDDWRWIAKCWVAKLTGQLVQFKTLLRGVSFKTTDIFKANEMDNTILKNLEGFKATLSIATAYDGNYVGPVGGHDNA